ncbi:MAG: 5'/3'-nucleotidase SurE [Syntrophomonadaceae bacterium]|nr:5'/3'-nucleotidase SurE [Syntrophomonadaceae bacterium]
MRILLTNDDGIHARGIQALVAELSKIAEIYMVAPDRERSATGHSITVFEPIKATQTNFAGVAKAWIVGGTPVDCVKLAMSKLVKDIDLVVSGINHGPNLGTDVLYSGTVSAAAEGVIMGAPAIAVSLDSYDADMEFNFAAKFTRTVVETVMQHEIDKSTLININIPFNRKERIKGIRVTKLGVRNYDNLFEERYDPRGNTYYWLGGGVRDEKQEAGSDVEAVQDGYISITPINLDLTDYDLINEYQEAFVDYLEWK